MFKIGKKNAEGKEEFFIFFFFFFFR